jgi:YfiH family protein
MIIYSQLLSDFKTIVHGISTKLGGNSEPPYYNNLSLYVGDNSDIVRRNRETFYTTLGIDQKRVAYAGQIHSSNIAIVNEPGLYRDTDALITNMNNIFLVISVADCYPVILYDQRNNVVANIHCGWRGATDKIVIKTFEKMIKTFSSAAEDIFVFIGPGISQDFFEVGGEVAAKFNPEHVSGLDDGKYRVDLKAEIYEQALGMGIDIARIEVSGLCTYREKDLLHSYRRDKEKSGRMFALVGLR